MIKLITITVLLVLGLAASNHSFLIEKATINEEVGLGGDYRGCWTELYECIKNCESKIS